MHCPKCLNHVPYGAKYCQSCGESIPEETRKAAYNKTFWGKLQRIEDWYNTITLKKFTGSLFFKIAILLLILAIGIINVIQKGMQTKILDSEIYTVQYNTQKEEYYILTDAEEVVLQLYVPKRIDTLILTGYDNNDNVLLERTISAEDIGSKDALRVKKDEYAYLTLNAMRSGKHNTSLKFLVLSEP